MQAGRGGGAGKVEGPHGAGIANVHWAAVAEAAGAEVHGGRGGRRQEVPLPRPRHGRRQQVLQERYRLGQARVLAPRQMRRLLMGSAGRGRI